MSEPPRGTPEWFMLHYDDDLDCQAQERYETIVFQMKAAEGITESLKADNQMEWVRRMSNIRNRAEETIREEMIYN